MEYFTGHPAFAQAADSNGGGGLITNLLPLIFIIVLFYFLLIRPQQKRTKQHREMLAALAVGDEVVTNGGIFGKVSKIEDQVVCLNLGGTEIKLQKQSVQMVLPKGSVSAEKG